MAVSPSSQRWINLDGEIKRLRTARIRGWRFHISGVFMFWISKIKEMLYDYNYCTMDEYKTAIEVVKNKFNNICDNAIKTADENADGKVSVKETAKQIKIAVKYLIKAYRSNSKEFWK